MLLQPDAEKTTLALGSGGLTFMRRPDFLLEHLSLTVLFWSPPRPKVASWEQCTCADVPTNLGQCKDYRAFTLNAPSFLKTY